MWCSPIKLALLYTTFVDQRTTEGFPLIIEAEVIELEESPVDAQMLLRLLPKLDYSAVLQAVKQLAPKCEEHQISMPDLPDVLPETLDETRDSALIANLHRVLFDIHLQEGWLVCPSSGRKFPVKDGIPNMILHEDEV